MTDLVNLFKANTGGRPDAFGGAQVYEAVVTRQRPKGLYFVIPGYDRLLEWGPLEPAGITGQKGDRIVVGFSDQGRPWLLAKVS